MTADRIEQNDAAVARARRMYQTVLAQWAIDMLRLRRLGMETPGVRRVGMGSARARTDRRAA